MVPLKILKIQSCEKNSLLLYSVKIVPACADINVNIEACSCWLPPECWSFSECFSPRLLPLGETRLGYVECADVSALDRGSSYVTSNTQHRCLPPCNHTLQHSAHCPAYKHKAQVCQVFGYVQMKAFIFCDEFSFLHGWSWYGPEARETCSNGHVAFVTYFLLVRFC